jgi:hypothetical protein
MQLYEWNSAAELAFRKTIASSANVWVNQVRVDSITARQINRRRSLLSTSALDTDSGALAVKARENGLSAVTTTTSVKEPSITTKSSSTALFRHFDRMFGLLSSLLGLFFILI